MCTWQKVRGLACLVLCRIWLTAATRTIAPTTKMNAIVVTPASVVTTTAATTIATWGWNESRKTKLNSMNYHWNPPSSYLVLFYLLPALMRETAVTYPTGSFFFVGSSHFFLPFLCILALISLCWPDCPSSSRTNGRRLPSSLWVSVTIQGEKETNSPPFEFRTLNRGSKPSSFRVEFQLCLV